MIILCFPPTWVDLSSTELLDHSIWQEEWIVCPCPEYAYSFMNKLLTSAAHCTISRFCITLGLMLVTLYFLGDLDKILTSEPTRPPLAPQSTRDSGLGYKAWST